MPTLQSNIYQDNGVSADVVSSRTFNLLRDLIHSETGITLGDAKRDLLRSRLARRIHQLGLEGFDDYYHYLLTEDRDGVELQQMVNRVTTTKTDFFRENHHFEFLRDHAFRQWRANAAATSKHKLRLWSVACSRGHEPYSIAITLLEHFGPRACWDIKILATDINTDVLKFAQTGVYPIEETECFPRAIRDRYFLKGTGSNARSCQVRDEVSSMVTFRQLNLTTSPWPFEGEFDAMLCRNVLIYFDEAQQRKLVSRLAERLTKTGFLFLGHSEHQTWLSKYVEPLGSTIYGNLNSTANADPRRSS